ncbi:MAG: SDR family oxidoreductase [Anaerolineae bacterium]|nr:SDR family oxidoreductase [Anaerolineae bacterium]
MLGTSSLLGADRRVLVIGGTGFVGGAVIDALLEANAQVTAMVPYGKGPLLGAAGGSLRVVEADVWNRGSLRGHGRGQDVVIHLVGSLQQRPERGKTYHHLNVASLQNTARMAVEDGVKLMIFLSAAGAPWLRGEYVQSKREAERYLQRSGIRWTVVRSPLVYPRGRLLNPLLIMSAIAGGIPLLGWPFVRWAPLPVDVLARGLAELALGEPWINRTVYGRQIRQLSRAYLARRTSGPLTGHAAGNTALDIEEEPPFGWLP